MRGLFQIGAPQGEYVATQAESVSVRQTSTVSLIARDALERAPGDRCDVIVIACPAGTGPRTLSALEEGRL